MVEHVVYLANSSGIKVGITRGTQVPTRWIDQGATQALPIVRTHSRLQSGLIETALKNYVADRTDWRRMLKADAEPQDLQEQWRQLKEKAQPDIDAALAASPRDDDAPKFVDEPDVDITYPVLSFPKTIKSLNFDKSEQVSGKLMGIKGQYLIFDCGVINVRRHGGYVVSVNN